MACSAEPASDDAIGSRVNVRFCQAAVMTFSAIGLAVIFSMPWLVSCLGLGRVAVHEVDGLDVALEQRLDDVRVRLEVVGPDDQVGGDVLAVRPQVRLVDEDLAAALLDEAGRPRLRHPGAVDLAGS